MSYQSRDKLITHAEKLGIIKHGTRAELLKDIKDHNTKLTSAKSAIAMANDLMKQPTGVVPSMVYGAETVVLNQAVKDVVVLNGCLKSAKNLHSGLKELKFIIQK